MAAIHYDIQNALGFLLNRNGKMMARRLHQRFLDNGFALAEGEWPVLVHLWIQDGRYQKELTDNLCRDKGSVARIIQVMEINNLVVRVADELDKRNKRIYLTHKGKCLKDKLLPLAMETTQEASKGIPEEEMMICKKVLHKIFENLSN